jgi:hypothetical protein
MSLSTNQTAIIVLIGGGISVTKTYPVNHLQMWTPQQERLLRQLAAQNTPTRVIALKLGRTEYAVRAKAAELGISLKPVNQSPYGSRS